MSHPRPLSPELRTLRERLRYDTPFWAGGVVTRPDGTHEFPGLNDWQGCMKILDKKRRLVPLIAHPWQLEFDAALERQRAEGKPMRGIVLKSRKLGFSTWIAAKFLQRLTQIEYQHAIICAQDVKTAGVIFNMALLAHRHLPSEVDIGVNVRPAIISQGFSHSGRKFMAFGEQSKRQREMGTTGESVLEVDTANVAEAGRGYTPSMVHLSEVAWWEGSMSSRKMLSLLNAVPREPETIVVLESTANGLNHFHRRWQSAVAGASDPESGESYIAHFVPWWRDTDAVIAFENTSARERFIEGIGDTRRNGEVAEDEPMLQELYGCTPEQLLWRRTMIREQTESNVELFRQEFPASADEAFIGSGRTVYSSLLVRRAIAAAEEAPKPVLGTLRVGGEQTKRTRGGEVKVPTAALWVPEPAAHDPILEVWEHPRQGDEPAAVQEAPIQTATAQSSPELVAAARAAQSEQRIAEQRAGAYIVAVDAAEGEANTFSDGDYHVIQVFDHHSRAQVAVHEGRMDIHLLPKFVLLVALYYNKAWLAIEVNGPGIAVLEPIVKDYGYGRMYRRRKVDTVRNRTENRPGWRTDNVTKPLMEAALGSALEDGTHGFRDPITARQLSTYVIDERGKHGAVAGEHDDRLIAAMIAHRVMDELRPPLLPRDRRAAYRPSDTLTGY